MQAYSCSSEFDVRAVDNSLQRWVILDLYKVSIVIKQGPFFLGAYFILFLN